MGSTLNRRELKGSAELTQKYVSRSTVTSRLSSTREHTFLKITLSSFYNFFVPVKQ